MKTFLRYFFFTLISFYLTQTLYFPFVFIDERMGPIYLLLVIAISTFFSRTFLKLIKLPHTGIGFYVLNTGIHFVSLFLSSIYLKKYSFIALDFSKYDLFDIISTPEIFLDKYTSLLMFSAIYCLIFGVLYFISWTHNKK